MGYVVTVQPVVEPTMPNFSGIYEIRCVATGKRYVGSAVRIAKRWRHHREALRGGRHHSLHLQRAWDKYGEAAFDFVVLMPCEKCELLTQEQRLMDFYRAADSEHGYNINPTAGSPLGRKFTPEQSAAHSERMKGKPVSDDARRQISASLMGNKRRLGHRSGPETIERLREASRKTYATNVGLRTYKFTEADKAKIGAAFKGGTLSEAHKAKISAAHKGKRRSVSHRAHVGDACRQFDAGGVASIRQLREQGSTYAAIGAQFGCSQQTIWNVIAGKGGYAWATS
jgi:group I intron endonuclease